MGFVVSLCKVYVLSFANTAFSVFILIYLIESWVSILAYCNPIAAQWDREVLKAPTTKCWPIETFRIFPLINTGPNPPPPRPHYPSQN